jgi:hypothetical protein
LALQKGDRLIGILRFDDIEAAPADLVRHRQSRKNFVFDKEDTSARPEQTLLGCVTQLYDIGRHGHKTLFPLLRSMEPAEISLG